MRRFITILIIVLLVAFVVLVGAWLLSRKKTEQQTGQALSFRQFLSGDVAVQPTTTTPGSTSSVFVDDTLTNTSSDQTASSNPIGTQSAQFTNSSSTPTNNQTPLGTTTSPTTGGTLGSGAPTTTTTTTTTTIDPTTQTPVGVSPIVTGPECSEADLNIQFNAVELQKLQALQTRFYAVAQYLHSDSDVSTETSNFDNFKSKIDKITELYNYCSAKAYAAAPSSTLADPLYQRRVPTPFWHELGHDTELFLSLVTNPTSAYDGQVTIGAPDANGSYLTPSNTPIGLRTLERSLRLNIW